MSGDLKTKFLHVVDEGWDQGNPDTLDEINAPGYIRHRAPFPDIVGLDALKEYVKSIR